MLLDPWVPLEPEVVQAMLALSGLKAGEAHLDLGAGDGRFVLAALERGARSYGVEIDAELARKVREHYGIEIQTGDVFDADMSQLDVVTFWFQAPGTEALVKKLVCEMKPSSRIVAYGSGWGNGWKVTHVPVDRRGDGKPQMLPIARYDVG